ncbi:MAG: DUF4330 domain-containing protein [Clostridiaceae bacterium]|jgi:hypothetical protein|nr:DUF4330 domain-containing protein [Clostridiaceae bacterium]
MFRKKSTWIIIAIALVIIIGIAGISGKFAKAKVGAPAAAQDKLIVTFYLENTPDSTIDAIKAGDPVRETVQNSNFGKITDIQSGESIFWANKDSGEFVASPREGYSSLSLTMETMGTINNNGVTIDKSPYYVGQTISLYAGKSFLKDGRISKIEKAD